MDVLELWQAMVGHVLSEERRRAFIEHRYCQRLTAYGRHELEASAKAAMRHNRGGHLLLSEWHGAVVDMTPGRRVRARQPATAGTLRNRAPRQRELNRQVSRTLGDHPEPYL